jgi:hypothetical protein
VWCVVKHLLKKLSKPLSNFRTSYKMEIDSKVKLELRGKRFNLEREALMELPESVLLCLFPNGVVLSANRNGINPMEGTEDDEEVYYVDVSDKTFMYLKHFHSRFRWEAHVNADDRFCSFFNVVN